MPPKFSAPPKGKLMGKGLPNNVQPAPEKKKLDLSEKALLKNIVLHYAFKHNVLIFPPGPTVDKVDPKTIDNVRSLLVYANFSNVILLLKRPDLVDVLFDHLNEMTKLNTKMTMFHFKSTNTTLSSSSIFDYLDRITDRGLKTSVETLLHDQEDCFNCLSHQADSILECGHQICLNCVNTLPKKRCPYCNKPFDKYFNKFEEKSFKKSDATKWSFLSEKETIGFFENRLLALVSSTSKISENDLAEIKVLCYYTPELVLKFLETHKIGSEETKFSIFGSLHISLMKSPSLIVKNTMTEKAFLKLGKVWMNTPNRMLRYLAFLETGTPDVDAKIMTTLNKTMTKWLVSIIATWKYDSTLCEQFNQHILIWKKFFKSIHAASYKKYPEFIDIVESVRGKHPFTIHSKLFYLDKYFLEENVDEILKIFMATPGICFRNLNRFCYQFKDLAPEEFMPCVEKCLNTMQLEQLIELKHVMEDHPKCDCKKHRDCASWVTKNGTLKFISPYIREARNRNHCLVSVFVVKTIQDRLDGVKNPNVSVAVISDSSSNIRIKKGKPQEQAKFTTRQPGGRGDVVDVSDIPRQAELVLYDYWECEKSIFLDLTMFVLNDEFKCVSTNQHDAICDFSNKSKFDGALVHSGDVYENGACLTSQYIKVNLGVLRKKQPEARYLVIAVLSFSGVSYDELTVANVGIGYRKSDVKGSGPYGSTVISACNLRGTSKMNIAGVLDIHTNKLTFANINVKPKGKGSIVVAKQFDYLAELTSHFFSWSKTPSSPMIWWDIALVICGSYDKVIVQTGKTVECFLKKSGESSSEFLARMKSGQFDAQDDEIKAILNGQNYNTNGKVWLHFGNNEFTVDYKQITLPPKSFVVSPHRIEGDSNLITLDDPFKILHIQPEKKK